LLYVNISKATAPRGINRAEFYIDNQLLFTNKNYPFNLAKNIGFLQNGLHNLKVRICDDIDNCKEEKRSFNLLLNSNQKEVISTTISWIYPDNGLAVTSIDFPLELEVSIGSPEQVKSIDYYLISQASSTPTLISNLSSINSNKAIYKWAEVPQTGGYTLYAEANMIDGQIIRSKQVKIMIKRISR